jgi:hypothetical protein
VSEEAQEEPFRGFDQGLWAASGDDFQLSSGEQNAKMNLSVQLEKGEKKPEQVTPRSTSSDSHCKSQI